MSFKMTHNVTIGTYKPFKVSSFTWCRKMDNYADSAKIVLPATATFVFPPNTNPNQTNATGKFFKGGDKVLLQAGYNGNNVRRFQGFIKRINWGVPLEIECEGYSYLLNKKQGITHTYQNVTMRSILEDLIKDTGIKLSPLIPNVMVAYARFDNCRGTQVLDWFKEKMLQTVYFNYNELYVGLRYLDGYKAMQPIQHRLNWNVIKDNDLVFDTDREGTIVNVQLDVPLRTGGYHKVAPPTPGNVKKMKLYGINHLSVYAQKIRDDIQKKENNKGYTGRITAFLEPLVELNSVTNITDGKFEDRTGKYVIEGIEGSYSSGGGRQKIDIGITI